MHFNTYFIIFTLQEVDNTVECKAVENKLDNDDINELAMAVSTKLRHLSKDESSVEEEESSSEVPSAYFILNIPKLSGDEQKYVIEI